MCNVFARLGQFQQLLKTRVTSIVFASFIDEGCPLRQPDFPRSTAQGNYPSGHPSRYHPRPTGDTKLR